MIPRGPDARLSVPTEAQPHGDLIRRAAGVLSTKPEDVVVASLDGLQQQWVVASCSKSVCEPWLCVTGVGPYAWVAGKKALLAFGDSMTTSGTWVDAQQDLLRNALCMCRTGRQATADSGSAYRRSSASRFSGATLILDRSPLAHCITFGSISLNHSLGT